MTLDTCFERLPDPMPAPAAERFWETTALAALTAAQWEALCDGCGKCCLIKFEDEDTGAIHYTNVACALLDPRSCECGDYARRAARVSDCIKITPATLANSAWLPRDCAYRRLAEGRALPDWHPLIAGDRQRMVQGGHGMHGRAIAETEVEDPLHHLVDWID